MPGQQERSSALLLTAISFAAGILLGIFAKWLDNLALDSDIGWHRVIERLDLGNFFSDLAIWLLAALLISLMSSSALRAAANVFLFFAGMCAAYHIYTILFAGFNPMSYMMIWYGITLASPVLAAACWYAGGEGPVSLFLDTGIVAVFFLSCFGIGIIYVVFKGIMYFLVFLMAMALICRNTKQMLISLSAGLVLAFLFASVWPFG